MWKSVTLVSLCLFVIQLRAEPEIKGSAVELATYLTAVPKLVSITGEAVLKIPADRAVLHLNVVTEHKSLQEASRVNQELRAKMLRTLADRGIPADRVQPSRFSSTPKYGLFGEKAKSYRVENIVKITTQDEKEFQAVANLVDSHPEVRYDRIEFEHSDKEGLKAKALAQAIDKVEQRRKLYAEKLGVVLRPKRFSEGIVEPVPDPTISNYAKAVSYRSSGPLPVTGLPEEAGTETPTSFGELIYKAQVGVEYALENQ